jgi:hypothetical protein
VRRFGEPGGAGGGGGAVDQQQEHLGHQLQIAALLVGERAEHLAAAENAEPTKEIAMVVTASRPTLSSSSFDSFSRSALDACS